MSKAQKFASLARRREVIVDNSFLSHLIAVLQLGASFVLEYKRILYRIKRMPDIEEKTSNLQTESLNGDHETIIAYLDLALKIYLRLKSDGQPIHKPQFDDAADPLYDHPGTGHPHLQEIQ